MARAVIHRDVQESTKWNLRVFLRELNVRLKELANAENFNEQLMWDDLRTPANSFNLSGPGSPPTTSTTYGWLEFAGGSTDNTASLQIQMPHDWAEGTPIVPHVHWMRTATGGGGLVKWELDYRHAPIGSTMDASWTTLDNLAQRVVNGTPDNDTAFEHLISSFGEVDTTGWGISDFVVCVLKRNANDTVNDTYGANAALLGFDIHYQRDAKGSVNEFNKDAN